MATIYTNKGIPILCDDTDAEMHQSWIAAAHGKLPSITNTTIPSN